MYKYKKHRLLMSVFGSIDGDGRVLRSIDALKDDFSVAIFGGVKQKNFSLHNVDVIKYKYSLPFYFRFLDHTLFHIKFILRALITRPSVIYVHDYYLSALGVMAGRLCGSKIIYDAHELIIDSSYNESKRNWFYAQLEKRTIGKYDLIISANEERVDQLVNFYNLKKQRVITVKNIPGNSVHDLTENFEKLKLTFPYLRDDKKYIVYQGVITPARNLEKVLDTLVQLKDYDLLIVGDGPKIYFDNLKYRYTSNTNIHFVGRVALDQVYSFIKISHCGIISYSMQNLNNTYCAPNKLYEYAQFNLRMITTDQVLFKKTFEIFPFGMILSPQVSANELEVFLSKKLNDSIFDDFKRCNSNEIEMAKLLTEVLRLDNSNRSKNSE